MAKAGRPPVIEKANTSTRSSFGEGQLITVLELIEEDTVRPYVLTLNSFGLRISKWVGAQFPYGLKDEV